jgi:hypothetical protein
MRPQGSGSTWAFSARFKPPFLLAVPVRASLAVLPVLLTGCVSQLLELPGSSHLAFACNVVDPLQAEEVELQLWRDEATVLDFTGAVHDLATALANATGRGLDDFTFDERAARRRAGTGRRSRSGRSTILPATGDAPPCT